MNFAMTPLVLTQFAPFQHIIIDDDVEQPAPETLALVTVCGSNTYCAILYRLLLLLYNSINNTYDDVTLVAIFIMLITTSYTITITVYTDDNNNSRLPRRWAGEPPTSLSQQLGTHAFPLSTQTNRACSVPNSADPICPFPSLVILYSS